MPHLTLSPRLRLHYQEHNPGGQPAVLLLHGLGVNSDSWGMQIPALVAAGYRVLVPDAPGFGRSTHDGRLATIAAIAGVFSQMLQRLEAFPAHVTGISMGGTLALQLALDTPEYVDHLVLVNTFARLRPETLSGWVYFATRYLLVQTLGVHTQARFVARRLFPGHDQETLRKTLVEQVNMADPRGYRMAMRALARFDASSRLNEVHKPTLVVTGDQDTTVAPGLQRVIACGIPGAKQVIIRGAGHAVVASHPEEFNQTLIGFLGRG